MSRSKHIRPVKPRNLVVLEMNTTCRPAKMHDRRIARGGAKNRVREYLAEREA